LWQPNKLRITNLFTPGIVFEDAPSGIRSGRAAGCKVIALLTTHTREQVEAAQPDFIVKDLSWRVF
jgi:glycerol-1-phosphatase